MLTALATGCHDYDACWRPVATPDGLPVAPGFGIVWTALLALCLFVLIRRLLRG